MGESMIIVYVSKGPEDTVLFVNVRHTLGHPSTALYTDCRAVDAYV